MIPSRKAALNTYQGCNGRKERIHFKILRGNRRNLSVIQSSKENATSMMLSSRILRLNKDRKILTMRRNCIIQYDCTVTKFLKREFVCQLKISWIGISWNRWVSLWTIVTSFASLLKPYFTCMQSCSSDKIWSLVKQGSSKGIYLNTVKSYRHTGKFLTLNEPRTFVWMFILLHYMLLQRIFQLFTSISLMINTSDSCKAYRYSFISYKKAEVCTFWEMKNSFIRSYHMAYAADFLMRQYYLWCMTFRCFFPQIIFHPWQLSRRSRRRQRPKTCSIPEHLHSVVADYSRVKKA